MLGTTALTKAASPVRSLFAQDLAAPPVPGLACGCWAQECGPVPFQPCDPQSGHPGIWDSSAWPRQGEQSPTQPRPPFQAQGRQLDPPTL